MLEQTLPVAFAVGSVMFALARLTGRAADPATEVAAKEGSAILLTEDFKLAHRRAMPRLTSNQWSFVRRDYPAANAVEWQVRLRSPEHEDPPLWENPCSVDFVVPFPSDAAMSLHWNKGSHDSPSDFQPREDTLGRGKPLTLESFGGRSSDGTMPYFNLASQGGGLILAVGWTGDWRASFEALGAGRVRVRAGLQRARFKLRAGEEVRLPSVLVMSYRGEWMDGQNQFRRLMLAAFTPTNHPPMELMPVAASVHGLVGFNDTTEEKLTANPRSRCWNLPPGLQLVPRLLLADG